MERLAKARHRILAYLFDWVVVFTFCIIVMLLPIVSLFDALNGTSNQDLVYLVISTLLYGGLCFIFIVFYFLVVPLFVKGQTLGKKIFRIKMVKLDGSDVDFLTLFTRELCGKVFIDFASFGFTIISRFITVALHENHSTFHDVLASTKVIDLD